MEEELYDLRVNKTQLDFIKKAISNMPAPSCDTQEYDDFILLEYDLDTTEPI